MDDLVVSGKQIVIDSSDSDGDEESEGDNFSFTAGNDEDVSFARPKSFAELRNMSENYRDLLGLGNLIRRESVSTTQSEDSSLGNHIRKLFLILREVASTESSYVRDLEILSQYLKDCTYSTVDPVRIFVASMPFVGFRVSVDSVLAINTHFCASLDRTLQPLLALEESTRESNLPPHDILTALTGAMESFCDIFMRYCPLFAPYQHLILRHGPVTQLFTKLLEDKHKEFQRYITDYEQSVGQSFLSLCIKPVQRLPRYILLLREVHNCCVSIAEDVAEDSTYNASMKSTQKKLKDTYVVVSDCTLDCNNAMRAAEDLQKLQDLNDALCKDHTNPRGLTVVTKTRVFVKEGPLRRWYDCAGVKLHGCCLLSDVLLLSSPRGRGGLHLDSAIPLYRNCGAVCLPLPLWRIHSGEASDPVIGGHWFVVVAKKINFFLAEDEVSQIAWVQSTRSVLLRNRADVDVFHSKNQIALTNALIDTYQQHVPGSSNGLEDGGSEMINDIVIIQAHWWKLLDMLEGITSAVSHLRSVLNDHFEEVAQEILRTFNPKKIGPVESLLSVANVDKVGTRLSAIPIATDWFFCAPKKGSKSFSGGNESTVFPTLLRVYLLSDVLIVSVVKGNFGRQAEYSFHIALSNLQFRSGSGRGESLSIVLIDSSIKEKKGIMASLWKSEIKREHTLVASSLQQKAAWLSLLHETAATSRNKSKAVWEEPQEEDPVDKLRRCSLRKVESSGHAFWQFQLQPKPTRSDRIE